MNELEAGCSSPVGAHALIKNDTLYFTGAVLSLDGSKRLDIERELSVDKAVAQKGREWAKLLKAEGAEELLDH